MSNFATEPIHGGSSPPTRAAGRSTSRRTSSGARTRSPASTRRRKPTRRGELDPVRPHVRNGRSESSLRNAESSGRNLAVRKPTVARGRGDQVDVAVGAERALARDGQQIPPANGRAAARRRPCACARRACRMRSRGACAQCSATARGSLRSRRSSCRARPTRGSRARVV
jgi:hypothetical protein